MWLTVFDLMVYMYKCVKPSDVWIYMCTCTILGDVHVQCTLMYAVAGPMSRLKGTALQADYGPLAVHTTLYMYIHVCSKYMAWYMYISINY